MAKLFVAAIAIGAFYANPAWGAEGLPRGADGAPLSDRWIQPGESFWLNPEHWVHTYQHFARQVPDAPGITVDLPSNEPEKLEPAPAEAPAATESVAIGDQVGDQAAPPPEDSPAPAPAPAPKKRSSSKKAAPAAPPADAPPAPDPTPAPEAPPAPEASTVAPDAPQE